LLKEWRRLSATFVGDGPDRRAFEAQAHRLGLTEQVHFAGAMPARKAFALGRLMVMPSRAESLPYVILEAVAAGKPLIATQVGGIPEILNARNLVPPAKPEALARAIQDRLGSWADSEAQARSAAQAARSHFSAAAMGEKIAAFYQDVAKTHYSAPSR
jgi:glycosyltransferase involved in cell wall biosynthesis